ncbi:MAG TPA: NAD(P)H-dependent oxidoreductase subunit E [Bacteroidales bacterium]|nr:NAD(P)H-dependent oxidoreductase subunit E [Lentimicrobiaceae bacterium]HOH99596.1 NAD(P)H-dependent oxidoreductase subunit E [Bacteroidales bacterium]
MDKGSGGNGNRKEIVICLGSSCFSRGNKKAVQSINIFLDQHAIRDKVHFHGAHCCGKCAEGAILRIGEKTFEHVEEEDLNDILMAELKGFLNIENQG